MSDAWELDLGQLIPSDPDWVVSPGAMLAEWARDNALTSREAAARVNLGIVAYLDLEAGELVLTEEIAEDLEQGTDIKAEMWLAMERIYRDGLAEGKVHVSEQDD
jgi:plasmid maintenance system antidote protein VapI